MPTTDSSVLRDGNRRTIWWGISSVDGTTLVPIQINSATGGFKAENGASVMPVISAIPTTLPRDGNRVPSLGGQSSTDSTIIIPVSVNPTNGAIQIQTT